MGLRDASLSCAERSEPQAFPFLLGNRCLKLPETTFPNTWDLACENSLRKFLRGPKVLRPTRRGERDSKGGMPVRKPPKTENHPPAVESRRPPRLRQNEPNPRPNPEPAPNALDDLPAQLFRDRNVNPKRPSSSPTLRNGKPRPQWHLRSSNGRFLSKNNANRTTRNGARFWWSALAYLDLLQRGSF